jgi:hypothetical protein
MCFKVECLLMLFKVVYLVMFLKEVCLALDFQVCLSCHVLQGGVSCHGLSMLSFHVLEDGVLSCATSIKDVLSCAFEVAFHVLQGWCVSSCAFKGEFSCARKIEYKEALYFASLHVLPFLKIEVSLKGVGHQINIVLKAYKIQTLPHVHA